MRQHVGIIFQSFNLFPHLTVGRNVLLAPSLVVKKRAAGESETAARKLLERVGLAEKFDAWPDQLAGGQQQRVSIARARQARLHQQTRQRVLQAAGGLDHDQPQAVLAQLGQQQLEASSGSRLSGQTGCACTRKTTTGPTELAARWICGRCSCAAPAGLPWTTAAPLPTAQAYAHKLHRAPPL